MNPNFEKGFFRGTKIPPYLVFTVGDFGCLGGNSSQLPAFARGNPFIRTNPSVSGAKCWLQGGYCSPMELVLS